VVGRFFWPTSITKKIIHYDDDEVDGCVHSFKEVADNEEVRSTEGQRDVAITTTAHYIDEGKGATTGRWKKNDG
jgi:hypothetical protein